MSNNNNRQPSKSENTLLTTNNKALWEKFYKDWLLSGKSEQEPRLEWGGDFNSLPPNK